MTILASKSERTPNQRSWLKNRRFVIASSLLLALVLLYQLLFSPPVVNRILHAVMPGQVDLGVEVKRSSLFFGFVFDKVSLVDRASGDPIFQADQVRLRWFLPGFLAGQVGVREVGLLNPSVSLVKRNNRWNTQAFSSAQPTEKKEKDKEEAESEPLEFIELFLPVRVYGAVRIEGFRLLVEEYSPRELSRLSLANVDLHLGFVSKTFHRIPLNTDAVSLVDSVFFAFSPLRKLDFEYSKTDQIKGQMSLMLKLYHESADGNTVFLSQGLVDTGSVAHIRSNLSVPFDAKLHYDVRYDPKNEKVNVKDLRITIGPDVWLALTGDVSKDQQGFHYANLKVDESNINLDRIQKVLLRLTDGGLDLQGQLSLLPFSISGRFDQLQAAIGLHGQNILFRSGSELHSVPYADLKANAVIDLYALGFVTPPDMYSSAKAKMRDAPEVVYGFLKNAKLDTLNASYNGSTLAGQGGLDPATGIQMNLNLSHFNLGQFTSPHLSGIVGANLKASSTTDFNRITVFGSVRLDAARYMMDRSLSGVQNLLLQTDLDLVLLESGIRIDIRKADLLGYSLKGDRLLHLLAGAELGFIEGQSYSIRLAGLDIDYANLHPLLPGNLRADLDAAKPYLAKGAHLDGNATLHFQGGSGLIQSNVSLLLPSISAEGLSLGVDVGITNDKIQLTQLQLHGLRGALNASLTGSLVGPSRQPYLDFRFNLSRQGMLPVHENVQIDGTFDIQAGIRPGHISGRIDIRRFNLIFNNDSCLRAEPDCTSYHVEDLNLALPFVHSMNMQPIQYQAVVNPDLIDRFPDKPNFTLRSVWSNRSPDGLAVKHGFYFLGSPAVGTNPAIEANFTYQRNVFESRLLRLSTYRSTKDGEKDTSFTQKSAAGVGYRSNGTIELRNLFFNVGDLNLNNMEYGTHVLVHDLNIEPYFPKADSSYDGIISATANVKGGNLADPLRNINARLAVYRISKDFTGLAVRIMVPSDIIARLVNNILEIPSMSAELRGGLVYTTIQVRSSGVISLSRLVKPADEMIRQERIPLAEFLERTKRETGEFQK